MEASERDGTADWLLPDTHRPPLIRELEARIDEALATARSSESAVMTVGAAALDAAEQAKRAADLAERASASAAEAVRRQPPSPAATAPAAAPAAEDASLLDFNERADRLAERLRQLQKPVPLGDPEPASSPLAQSGP